MKPRKPYMYTKLSIDRHEIYMDSGDTYWGIDLHNYPEWDRNGINECVCVCVCASVCECAISKVRLDDVTSVYDVHVRTINKDTLYAPLTILYSNPYITTVMLTFQSDHFHACSGIQLDIDMFVRCGHSTIADIYIYKASFILIDYSKMCHMFAMAKCLEIWAYISTKYFSNV